MPEQLYGNEALSQLPFVDVVLDFDTALSSLTERTRTAVIINLDYLIGRFTSEGPEGELFKQNLGTLKDHVDEVVTPGGFSLSQRELEKVYQEMGKSTFKGVARFLMESVFPEFLDDLSQQGSRGAGSVCLGYLLDLINIRDPKIASFDDGVRTVIAAMRESGYALHPAVLGSMVDDALKLKGSASVPFEFIIGRDEVEEFRQSYLKFANGAEQQAFNKGLEASLNDMAIRSLGVSFN